MTDASASLIAQYAATALARECEAVARAVPGEQEITLNRAAIAIGGLVKADALASDEAVAALVEAGLRMDCVAGREPWTRVEIEKKIARAFQKATARTLPERSASTGRRSSSPGLAERRLKPDPAADWARTEAAEDTVVERYLRSARGYYGHIPEVIRFARSRRHHPTSTHYPVMVARVDDVYGRLIGTQQTFILPDGSDRLRQAKPRWQVGEKRGGAVRLFAPIEATIALVEGVESGLALHRMTGAPTWAVLGSENMAPFGPPPEIERVILAPDADAAGRDTIQRAGSRLSDLGLTVEVLLPPAEDADWADLLADFEERAAVLEFDVEHDCATAEHLARAEIIGGDA